MFAAKTSALEDLAPSDEAAWRVLQADHPVFANPLMGPDFARAVARVRDDVRVTVFRQDGQPVGFLAYHQRGGGLARAVGAPFSDYHGLVALPGAIPSAGQALAVAGLSGFRSSGLVDPEDLFGLVPSARRQAFKIVLDTTGEAYVEALRAASPKRFKNYRRLESKTDRELGPVRMVADDRSQAAFDLLMGWKTQQLVRTGASNVLRPDWTCHLMQSLFDLREGPMVGLMITYWAGDTLMSGHFGVRTGDYYHPWIASTHPDMAVYSPGQAFIPRAIMAMDGLGLRTYDLGPDHGHYKQAFCTTVTEVGEGLHLAASPAGRRMGAQGAVWTLIGGNRNPSVDRLRRRLDHIAQVELTLAGRLRGLASAVSAYSVRGASRDLGGVDGMAN